MASPRHPAKLLERLDVKKGLVSEAERAVLAPELAASFPLPRSARPPAGLAEMPAPRPHLPEEGRGRGRPPRHEEPVQQTTIRLTRAEWAALQAQVTKETLERGERRYVTDIIRDAIADYLARRG
jgi:hypothetical protein